MDEGGWHTMTETILPGARRGRIAIPSSKSAAHRHIICAALSSSPVDIRCAGLSEDILATMSCLRALGADLEAIGETIRVRPLKAPVDGLRTLNCGESGSTLRFMLAVAGALGADAKFTMEGRLPERPLAPYDDELCAHGMTIVRDGNSLRCSGALRPGAYTLPGGVSSQFVSGLLLALPLLDGESTVAVSGKLESADYVAMTLDALRRAGACVRQEGGVYHIRGCGRYRLPASLAVEGDFSSAAFFLCAGALSPDGVCVSGLNPDSIQGDRRVTDILHAFGASVTTSGDAVCVRRGALSGITVDASMIPDLVPALSAVAAVAEGETRIINARRLRLKESDRLESTAAMLRALGADISQTPDGLIIRGVPSLDGGCVEVFNDHRIAMAAAVAACACKAPVAISGAECVGKSYPGFWRDFSTLEAIK